MTYTAGYVSICNVVIAHATRQMDEGVISPEYVRKRSHAMHVKLKCFNRAI